MFYVLVFKYIVFIIVFIYLNELLFLHFQLNVLVQVTSVMCNFLITHNSFSFRIYLFSKVNVYDTFEEK